MKLPKGSATGSLGPSRTGGFARDDNNWTTATTLPVAPDSERQFVLLPAPG